MLFRSGEIMQVPPVYSALKQGGEPLYRLARKGLQPEIESRPVRIRSLEILYQTAPNRFLLKIVCGKGVYIRSLMRDIGDALGCGGCMSFLLRTQSGALEISNAVTLDELQALDSPFEALLPPDVMLTTYPKTVIATEKRMNILNGQTIRPEWLITDRKSTRLNSSHPTTSRMPSSA